MHQYHRDVLLVHDPVIFDDQFDAPILTFPQFRGKGLILSPYPGES